MAECMREGIASALAPSHAPTTASTPPFAASSHMSGGRDPWLDFWKPWEIVNAAYMHYTRNVLVKAAAAHLGGKLALVGKGWGQLGLRARADEAAGRTGEPPGRGRRVHASRGRTL